MSENEMASDVLNQGTVNAKNEFRIDPKDLELHMEKRFNFEPTKVGENTDYLAHLAKIAAEYSVLSDYYEYYKIKDEPKPFIFKPFGCQ